MCLITSCGLIGYQSHYILIHMHTHTQLYAYICDCTVVYCVYVGANIEELGMI